MACEPKSSLIVGKCHLMCPESERLRRERMGQLSVIEIDHTQSREDHTHYSSRGSTHRKKKPVSSRSLAVKEYVRAGAGHIVPSPDDLRPAKTLVETMNYLMNSVITKEDIPWHIVYGFINNRCQSVRQDITYQQLEGPEVVYIYQLSVRFYIYSQYRLAGEKIERFDRKLNSDQLQQCLSKLLRLCNTTTTTTTNSPSSSSGRGKEGGGTSSPAYLSQWSEAVSYYLLANLGSDEAVMHILSLPRRVRTQPDVHKALRLNYLVHENNFVRFFRVFSTLSPLAQCAAYYHLEHLQRKGLRLACNAYCVGNRPSHFPLRVLAKWLMLLEDEATAAEYCTAHGLAREGEDVLLIKQPQIPSPSSEVPTGIVLPQASQANCRKLMAAS